MVRLFRRGMIAEDEVTAESGERGNAALLLIDMVNDLVSKEGEALPKRVREIVEPVERLREAADAAGLPVIYVNDNFGDWHADADAIVAHCLGRDSMGHSVVERLRPRPSDYFVIKPQFSGFYSTNLPAILPRLGVTRLILAGVAADICVLFTAADAHMREYGLWVPQDAVASSCEEHRDWALGIMAKSMAAETRRTDELAIEDWLKQAS